MEIYENDLDLELQFNYSQHIRQLESIITTICRLLGNNQFYQEKAYEQTGYVIQMKTQKFKNEAQKYKKEINILLRKQYLLISHQNNPNHWNIMYPIIEAVNILRDQNHQESINFFSLPSKRQFKLIIEQIACEIKSNRQFVGYIQINLAYYLIILQQNIPYQLVNIVRGQRILVEDLYQIIKLYYQQINKISFFQNLLHKWYWKKAKFLQIGLASKKGTDHKNLLLLKNKLKGKIVEIGDNFLKQKPFHWIDYIYFDKHATLINQIKKFLQILKVQKRKNEWSRKATHLLQLKKLLMLPQIFQILKEQFISKCQQSNIEQYIKNLMVELKKQVNEQEIVFIQDQVFNSEKSPNTSLISQLIENNKKSEAYLSFFIIYSNILIFRKQGVQRHSPRQSNKYAYQKNSQAVVQIFWNQSHHTQIKERAIQFQQQNMRLINIVPNSLLKKKNYVQIIKDNFNFYPFQQKLLLESPQNLIKNNQLSAVTQFQLFEKALQWGQQTDTSWKKTLQIIPKLYFLNRKRIFFSNLKAELQNQFNPKKLNSNILNVIDRWRYVFTRPEQQMNFKISKLVIPSFVIHKSTIMQNIIQQLFTKHSILNIQQFPLIIANKQLSIGVYNYSNGLVSYIHHKSNCIQRKKIKLLLNQFFIYGQNINLYLTCMPDTQMQINYFKQLVRIIQKYKSSSKQNNLPENDKFDQKYCQLINLYSKSQKEKIYCTIKPSDFYQRDCCGPKTHYNSLPIRMREKILEFKFDGQNSKCFFYYFYWNAWMKFTKDVKQIKLYNQFTKISKYTKLIQKEQVWSLLLQSIIVQNCLSLLQDYQLKRGYCPLKLGKYLHGDDFKSIQLYFNNKQSKGQQLLSRLFKDQKLRYSLQNKQIIIYYLEKGKQLEHYTFIINQETYQKPQNQKPDSLILPPNSQIVFNIVMFGDHSKQKVKADNIIQTTLGPWETTVLLKQPRFNCYKYKINP